MKKSGPTPYELAMIAASLNQGKTISENSTQRLINEAFALFEAAQKRIRGKQVEEVVGIDKIGYRRRKGGDTIEIRAQATPITTKEFLRQVIFKKSHGENVAWLKSKASHDHILLSEIFKIFWPETDGEPPEGTEFFNLFREFKTEFDKGEILIPLNLTDEIIGLFEHFTVISPQGQVIALGVFLDRLNEIFVGKAAPSGTK